VYIAPAPTNSEADGITFSGATVADVEIVSG